MNNLSIRHSPLVFVAVAMALGIFTAYECQQAVAMSVWLYILVAMVVAALSMWRKMLWQSVAILMAFFSLGAYLLTRQTAHFPDVLPNDERAYEAVIMSEPRQRGKVIQMDLRMVSGPLQGQCVKASLLRDTVDNRYKRLHLGDGILAVSRFEQPKRYGDAKFNYPLYLKCHGFSATSFIYYRNWRKAEVDMTSLSLLERTKIAALSYRQRLIDKYSQLGMHEDELAVAMAMTLGDKSRLTGHLRDLYSVSGASHVLALSGLHIGIIYMLMVVLVGYRRWSLLRETVLILGIWAYAFLTGLSPSVTRAAVMLTIYSLASLLGRDRMSLNALAFTAIIMLAVHPLNLYDVGFQLSFMAVLSILLFYRLFFGLVPEGGLDCVGWGKVRPVRWAWAMVVVSVCAQLGTAPLTMFYFGRFSVYFLLTNFVVIPLAYAILMLTVILMIASVWPTAQLWLAGVLSLVVGWQNNVLSWIASLPGSHIEGISLTAWQVAVIYLLVFSPLLWWRRRVER
ncbi:MAG: ComEC/Rec2 family competence protein [Prevotella sp.]|nr:ComEC/Rec2 family competence protein [Prevotella sp.]